MTPARLARMTAVLAVLAASAVLAAPSASAADAGDLFVTPARGSVVTPMSLTTEGPCPAAATNVDAVISGAGVREGSDSVVSNTTVGFSRTQPVSVPLQDTMSGFAASLGISLRGEYTFTVRCIDEFAQTVFATFAGTVTFAADGSYRALGAAASPAPTPTDDDAPAQPSLGATPAPGGAAPTASAGAGAAASGGAQPQPGQSGGGAAAGSTDGAVQPAASAPREVGPDLTWLAVPAFCLLALAVFLSVRGSRRDDADAGTDHRESTLAGSGGPR